MPGAQYDLTVTYLTSLKVQKSKNSSIRGFNWGRDKSRFKPISFNGGGGRCRLKFEIRIEM